MKAGGSSSPTTSESSTGLSTSGFCSLTSSSGYRTREEQDNRYDTAQVNYPLPSVIETLEEAIISSTDEDSLSSSAEVQIPSDVVEIPPEETETFARCQRIIDLLDKTNYTLIQVNGQRIYGGPPPHWKGPSPPKGSEVFAGNLPRDCFEDELVPIFRRAGQIYEMRLMMQFSGENRGYAYITYSTPEEARKAIEALDNTEIRPNCRIGVVLSTNNCRVYVGGDLSNVTADNLIQDICLLTSDVVEVNVHQGKLFKTRREQSRDVFIPQFKTKYVVIEYTTHRAAAMAKRKLIPEANLKWGEHTSIEWAVPKTYGKVGRIITGNYCEDSGLKILRVCENSNIIPKNNKQNRYQQNRVAINDIASRYQEAPTFHNSRFLFWHNHEMIQNARQPHNSGMELIHRSGNSIPLSPSPRVIFPPPCNMSVPPPPLPFTWPPCSSADNPIQQVTQHHGVICPNVYKNLIPCNNCLAYRRSLIGMSNTLVPISNNFVQFNSSGLMYTGIKLFAPISPPSTIQVSPYITELLDN